MHVRIPGPLRSYTDEADQVEASGTTLGELLDDLDRQHPGIRFRIIDEQGGIRRHIKFFVDAALAPDLSVALVGRREVMIVCALTGG
jgi:hypothetical protein